MADPPRYPDSSSNTGDAAATPRWVKVFGIIALVVVLLFVILMFTRGPGGRGHGPGLHAPSGDTRGQTPPEGGRR
jgi:hypothetical protein